MKQKCSECQHGGYDPCSDYCDSCMNDSNTGWTSFYDHRIGRNFTSEEEQQDYYREHLYDDEDENNY